jgi:hypothetical protein
VDAVRVRVDPAHSGPLLPAVGVAGAAFTVTTVTADVAVQVLAFDTVTE